MFKGDLLLPALLGLGLFAQNGEINLSNNTTMLLTLFLLLQDHQELEQLEHRVDRIEDNARRFGTHFRNEDFFPRDCCDCFCADFGRRSSFGRHRF